MAKNYMTPGVYIEEVNAFPGSVVEVATAVPAFIGYTEKASRKGKSILMEPTRITSLKEYHEFFGGAFVLRFKLVKTAAKAEDLKAKAKPAAADKAKDTDKKEAAAHTMKIGIDDVAINYEGNNLFFYDSLRLFFENGGSSCYIVSVNTYGQENKVAIDMDELKAGLATLLKEQEPTMIVIPEAVKLGEQCYDLYKLVLAHCAKMQNRVAILDIYDGDNAEFSGNRDNRVSVFREKIGTENLSYAAAYYPWLDTNITGIKDINFENFDTSADISELKKMIPDSEEDAIKIILDFQNKSKNGFKDAFKVDKPEITDETEITENLPEYIKNKKENLHLGLVATSPTYSNILTKLREIRNLLPTASAMAGIYTMVDNNRGVWKAPANISLNQVIKPSTTITHEDQENLNVDAISGKSINAIRTFPGVGTLVWGGRTLDGNSLDWRYINVRRTMIMLEQSIKLALRAYVFEPNDTNTWVTVKSMIVNFLTDKWKQGALAGASPEDAFDVQIGLGSTMTGVDILEGKMLVSIKLAIVRPAEFIEVTFEQQMQK